MSVVLDSSAILAWAWREPGMERVAAVLDGAKVSAANWGEVATRFCERGWRDEDVHRILGALPATVVPFDAPEALAAGLLRRATRAAGLSLGERACLTLAQAEGLPAVTADRAWAGLDLGVAVEVVR